MYHALRQHRGEKDRDGNTWYGFGDMFQITSAWNVLTPDAPHTRHT